METWHGSLKGFFHQNPFYSQKIKIFAKQRPQYGGFYFTKNCPLVPVFKRGMSVLRERGVIKRIKDDWEGNEPPRTFGVETETLGPGHVILVFLMFGTAFSLAALVFVFEIIWSLVVSNFLY